MLGTIVNTLTIIAGSAVGSFAKRGIRREYQQAMYRAMASPPCSWVWEPLPTACRRASFLYSSS